MIFVEINHHRISLVTKTAIYHKKCRNSQFG